MLWRLDVPALGESLGEQPRVHLHIIIWRWGLKEGDTWKLKEIMVPKWECEYCGEVFDNPEMCNFHELEEVFYLIDRLHLCPVCKHSYYVYGCERNCARENKGKKCKFEKEEATDE